MPDNGHNVYGCSVSRGNRGLLWPDLDAHPNGHGESDYGQQEREQNQDPATYSKGTVVVV